jgi:anti-sigma regulatory factor (Ser/Thr protein kinase)
MPDIAPVPDLRLSWSHETTLEASPISASRARAFVSHHLADHRLPHLIAPVRLVVSELATNAVVHGRAPNTTGCRRAVGA